MVERKYLILGAVAALIVAVDQLTKIYIHTNFELGEYITVIADYFNITYVRNTGAAFGFLRDSHETFRTIFFLSMPPLAMVTILAILRGVSNEDKVQITALSGIFGGAIGNYLDRLRFGFVVDFLDFHWQNKYSFPAFNVADSAIVVGVAVLLWLMRKSPESPKESSG
ncbi:MAG: signal peptidase II [Bdellovibrionales bacterium]